MSKLHIENVFPGLKMQKNPIFFGLICFHQLNVSQILFFFSRFEFFSPTFLLVCFLLPYQQTHFSSKKLSTLERSIVTLDCLHLSRRRHCKFWTFHLNSFLRVNATTRCAGSIWIVFSRKILPYWDSLFPLTLFLRAATAVAGVFAPQ